MFDKGVTMDTAHAVPAWQAAILGLFGLLYVFTGYRAVRFTARVTSAALCMQGALLASADVQHVWVQALIVSGSGLAGFLLGNAFYFVTVGLYGAAGGGVLALVISLLATQTFNWGVVIGSALAGLLLAVLLERPILIVCTSLIGAGLSAFSLMSAMVGGGVHAPERFKPGYLAFLFVLALAGCIVQAKTTKNLPPPPPSKGQPERVPLKA